MKNRFCHYFINLLIPSFVFGSVTGIATAAVICLYKLCAMYVIQWSVQGYDVLRGAPWWLALVFPVLLFIAWLFARTYRKYPNLSGGGIPTSIGVLRGILPLHAMRNLFGVFAMSLTTFLVGVPLGTEGPAVQMGTAVGKGCVRSFSKKKHWAWERYSMTGGACAGFSAATGAPISGILFAVEEAHQRISPMLLIVSATSVMFAEMTSKLLSSFLPIHTTLFPKMQLVTLTPRDVWLPLVIGVAIGLFAVAFLKYYRVIRGLVKRLTEKISPTYLIFFVFVLTVLFGLCSDSFVSTGHELILSLFDGGEVIWLLLLILPVACDGGAVCQCYGRDGRLVRADLDARRASFVGDGTGDASGVWIGFALRSDRFDLGNYRVYRRHDENAADGNHLCRGGAVLL